MQEEAILFCKMTATKAHIIAQLQKDIAPLQGYKKVQQHAGLDKQLGSITNAFPGNSFPLGVVHEFICDDIEVGAATNGFVAGMLAALMESGGIIIWIGSNKNVFPPALKSFGIAPDRIIFINLYKEKEMLWAIEEALKCEGLTAVIGELKELSFNESRRLQLAVEQSRVTGFILRNNPRSINTTACITRWKISSLPGRLSGNMPGVGFPRWNVELLKVRNGKPGSWQIEYVAGRFKQVYKMVSIAGEQKRQTG
ncbi:ImuA family protein [soil metagenome]